MNFLMFKLDLEKAEEQEIKLSSFVGSEKKQENPRNIPTSTLLTMQMSLTMCITTDCGKLPEMRIPDHLACLRRNLSAGQEATVRTELGTADWFQIRKGVYKAVYCHPAYLNYMLSTSRKMPKWMKHNLESRFLGEISITTNMQMTLPS